MIKYNINKPKTILNKSFAFTLAEVLITLGIIGVVAAMTIPTLMNNISDAQYKSALKKAYSSLSQAFITIQSDNSGTFAGLITNNDTFRDSFKDKLKNSKACNYNDATTLGACFATDSQIKYLNGSPTGGSYTNNNTGSYLILSDGTTLAFFFQSTDCSINGTMGRSDRCGWILADVNGLKKPNQWGKDIYMFMVFSKIILPAAPGLDVMADDDCNAGINSGLTCASKYIMGN